MIELHHPLTPLPLLCNNQLHSPALKIKRLRFIHHVELFFLISVPPFSKKKNKKT